MSRARSGKARSTALKNPRRCPCSPSRRSGSAPGPSGPGIPWPRAWRWPRRPAGALRPRPAHAWPPAGAACVPARCGCRRRRGLVGHVSVSSHRLNLRSVRTATNKAHTRTVKSQRQFLYLAYSHVRGAVLSTACAEIAPNRRPFPFPRCFRSMPPQRFALPSEVPGLAARRIAADILDGVLHKHRTLDDQLDGAGAHPGLKTLSDRDRALMRRLVATILRRLGTLGHVLSRLLDRGIPTDAPRAQSALLIGAAQILWMDVPDHAAVDLSVRLVQSDRRAAKYAGLVNAVLRRCAREGPAADRRGQVADAGCSAMAAGALDRALRRDHRPGDRGGARPRAVARYHREIRCRAMGDPAARRNAADGNGAHAAAGLGDDAAGLRRRPVVGAGRRRRACRRGCSATSPARPSPISAPHPAARPRNWSRPARASPRSTVRPAAWRGCATISRGWRWRPRPW